MNTHVQNNLLQKYSGGTIVLHWLTVLLILLLFPLGKYMAGFAPSEKMGLIKIHNIFGFVVFILTSIRSYFFSKRRVLLI